MLEVNITYFFLGGGRDSLINISRFTHSVTFLVQTCTVSVVPMECLHTATSVVGVWSLAMEFG
jgi:hypothetical protein